MKSKYPVPSVQECLAYLPRVAPPLRWRYSFLAPDTRLGTAQLAVELVWTAPTGWERVWRREGEQIRLDAVGGFTGALMRACLRHYTYLDGKSDADVLKLAAWQLDVLG